MEYKELNKTLQLSINALKELIKIPDVLVVDIYSDTLPLTMFNEYKHIIVKLEISEAMYELHYSNIRIKIGVKSNVVLHEILCRDINIISQYAALCNKGCSICFRITHDPIIITNISTRRLISVCSLCQKDPTKCSIISSFIL